MTHKEWLSKSEDWREGYNAFAHNYAIVNYWEKSDEWNRGFAYACNLAINGRLSTGVDEGDR